MTNRWRHHDKKQLFSDLFHLISHHLPKTPSFHPLWDTDSKWHFTQSLFTRIFSVTNWVSQSHKCSLFVSSVKAVALAPGRKTSALLLQTSGDVQITEGQEFAFTLLLPKSKNNKNIIYIAPSVSVQELVEADIFLLELRSPSAHLWKPQAATTDRRTCW